VSHLFDHFKITLKKQFFNKSAMLCYDDILHKQRGIFMDRKVHFTHSFKNAEKLNSGKCKIPVNRQPYTLQHIIKFLATVSDLQNVNALSCFFTKSYTIYKEEYFCDETCQNTIPVLSQKDASWNGGREPLS
jgi:hypothetical protein